MPACRKSGIRIIKVKDIEFVLFLCCPKTPIIVSKWYNYGGFIVKNGGMHMQETYTYRNLPIPGGGYVTGFAFHESEQGILYLRTDIGGTYRFDSDKQRWESLINHVNMKDLRETFPIAVALDPKEPGKLYIACGIWNETPARLAVSSDFGAHFTYYDMPMRVHGNLNGRGTGYRLIVDAKDSERLYFASQADGLWSSPDGGASWEKISAMPEDYLTFVGQTKDGGALIVGSAGITTARSKGLRGKSLYVSYDDGRTFSQLWQPEDGEIEGVKLAGLVAQRYTMDKHYLYVTYSVMGPNAYVLEHGYSCDGGSVIGGKVVRYSIGKDQIIGHGDDITPPIHIGGGANMFDTPEREAREALGMKSDRAAILDYGFGGISCTEQEPGLLVVSTISKEDGDCVYRSFDYGQTWTVILYDLSVGRMDFRTSYMTPKYNGGHNLIHWLTDIKINPFDSQEMWFNTGTGVFRTKNLLEESVVFSDWCDGLEETVHLNLYSPPKGEVQLIDILGDLGGFAFRDLDRPCDNSFDDAEGNRYITCINADYSDADPNTVIVTPRGNWTGKTKGGLILSTDQCRTFRRLAMPYGISAKIDQELSNIERPNVNSGWAAISPDCRNIVWSVADIIFLPADMVLVSHDGGESFDKANVFDSAGKCISDLRIADAVDVLSKRYPENENTDGEDIVYAYGMKVFSDRSDSQVFYGFGRHFEFYVSTDGGANFYQKELPQNVPVADFSLIDCANKTEVRGECGKVGVFYMALREHGLYKLVYDKAEDKTTLKKLSKDGDIFYRMGLGVIRPGADYYKDEKAIYAAATISGEYGFYRSTDEGESFTRLNTDEQMYGEVNSLEGDSRVYGRFYIATGSRGVLYGEPCK